VLSSCITVRPVRALAYQQVGMTARVSRVGTVRGDIAFAVDRNGFPEGDERGRFNQGVEI